MSSAATVRSHLAAALPAWQIAACAGLCIVLGACSSKAGVKGVAARPTDQTSRQTSSGSALATLRAISQRQQSAPDAKAMATPAPEGMTLAPSHEDATRRSLSLDEAILAATSASPSTLPPIATPTTPDPEKQIQSAKLYVEGKARLVAGQFGPALTSLEEAARLDPDSSEILRELGAAQAASGKRAAATATYRRAVAKGLRDPRIAAFLGRETLRARQFESAAAELIHAISLCNEPQWALTRSVAQADLADAFSQLGYRRASAQLLSQMLGTLPGSPAGQLRPEEAELYRRRADLWLRAGDLHASRGAMDDAAAAYESAAMLPGGESRELMQRRLYVLLARGMSAQATISILEQLCLPDARPTSGQFELLGKIVGSSQIGPEIINAASELACDPSAIGSATLRSSLMLAVTNEALSEQSQAAMGAYLRFAADPSRGVHRYCELFASDTAARTRAFAHLCEVRPDLSIALARSLVNFGSDLQGSVTWCERNTRTSGGWILAHALSIALGTAPPASPPPAALAEDVVHAVLAFGNAHRGNWDQAFAHADAVSANAPAELRAAVLAGTQQYAAAVDVADSPRTFPILKATWCLNVGKTAQVEEILKQQIAADPFDERPYEVLLNLYSPRAALANDERLGATARQLRDWIPDSKFAQSIAARDLASKSQWTQASELLLGSLQSADENAAIIAMLVAICERSYAADPQVTENVYALVSQRLKQRPDSPPLIMAQARLLALVEPEDHAAASISLLDQSLARFPNPDLARLRESLLRELIKDTQRADASARERLSQASRGVDQSIEYAALLLRSGEYDAAASVIASGLPQRVQLSREQSAALVSLAAAIDPEKLVTADPARSAAALVLFDQIAGRGITMTPSMHLSRLLVLCASASSDALRVHAALEQAVATLPDLAQQLPTRVAQVLLSKPDPTDGLRFLAQYVNNSKPYPEEFAFEWFRIAFTRGDKEDFRDLVQLPREPALLLRSLSSSVDDELIKTDGDEASLRAEIAYWIGNATSSDSKEDLAEYAYRLALELNPDHAWTLNNLGYNLLVRERGPIEEAARMITKAYEQLPDEASVIDSMGWLMYRQGRFADVTLPDGTVVEGAASILSRAVNNLQKPASAEQCEHLGDALWRLGNKPKATMQWDNAQRLIESQLSLIKAAAQPGTSPRPQEIRLNEQLSRLRTRLDAAARGQEPPVARTHAEESAPSR
jgi:tetratricopeptide (TPR) repeat protein